MSEEARIEIRKGFLWLVEITFWLGVLSALVLAWFMPLSHAEQRWLLVVSLLAVAYLVLFFRWVIPRYGPRPWLNYTGMVGAMAVIGGYALILKPHGVNMEIILVTIIASMGIMAGRRVSLWAAFLAAALEVLLTALQVGLSRDVLPLLALQSLLLLISGYVVSFLTGTLHEKVLLADRRNRYLSMLLRAGTIASQSDDLHITLTQIAELITRHIPATACRIWLLSQPGDHLVTYGAFPARPLEGWDITQQAHSSIQLTTQLRRALESNPYLVIQKSDASPQEETELTQMGFQEARTVCLLPLVTKNTFLGLIAIGEARRWEREPFTQDKLALLQTLATQLSAVIHNTSLYQATQRHADRMAMLNEVARAIGSTIELDDLLELIYEQLSRVIPSDTYFVSLFDAQEKTLDLRILIDGGERFPPQRLPLGQGFSGWVLENRRPLLIRHLSEEIDDLPAKPVTIGQDRWSESWLGMPILAGEQALGLLAIASYAPNAFNEDDLNLLNNVAAQAALALDNARQHAAVKEQARRDSLTGLYNHGHLLLRLSEEVERNQAAQEPVSLIMLDIDYFKAYNDSYGHVVGDEVLRHLASAIQKHVNNNDIVGRWGGEEFAIVLPGATTQRAFQVAEHIRASLAALEMYDHHGKRLPPPTISQGIATLPTHAQDVARLVDIADMALYQAKGKGRDQVMSAEAYNL